MAPDEKGIVGQILHMEIHEGPLPSECKSFVDWLTNYRDKLYQGEFEVNEDGYLVEKFD
jgi:hypothetical protein